MKNSLNTLASLCALACLILSPGAFAEDEGLQEKEMKTLSRDLSRALLKCPGHKPKDVFDIFLSNKTSEFVDKDKFLELLRKDLPTKKTGPDAATHEVKAALMSEESQKNKKRKTVYTLYAVTGKGCEASVTLLKLGAAH